MSDEIKKSLERLKEDLKIFKDVNDAIKEINAESKEADKKEDRRFQIEILKVQLGSDVFTSIFSVIMSILVL